jgi:hypothetical protein
MMHSSMPPIVARSTVGREGHKSDNPGQPKFEAGVLVAARNGAFTPCARTSCHAAMSQFEAFLTSEFCATANNNAACGEDAHPGGVIPFFDE